MARPLFTMLVMCLLATVAHAAPTAEKATDDEKRDLAGKVFKIFEAKCADCHGAHLPKPKGKFGYVLDLKRVAANEEYIVPGDPKESELYQMVKNDEMPGEDADVPPLTDDEKQTVERWVKVGAPYQLSAEHAAAAQAAVPKAPSTEPNLPFFKRVLRLVGSFHSASTHFPIALLMAALLAEFFAWKLRKPAWLLVVRFLVITGALAAVQTATLGWINGAFSSYGSGPHAWVFTWHRILGTVTALWAVACAVLIVMDDCVEGSLERRRFRGALFVGAGLVSLTGFLGGALVYGLDHYHW